MKKINNYITSTAEKLFMHNYFKSTYNLVTIEKYVNITQIKLQVYGKCSII